MHSRLLKIFLTPGCSNILLFVIVASVLGFSPSLAQFTSDLPEDITRSNNSYVWLYRYEISGNSTAYDVAAATFATNFGYDDEYDDDLDYFPSKSTWSYIVFRKLSQESELHGESVFKHWMGFSFGRSLFFSENMNVGLKSRIFLFDNLKPNTSNTYNETYVYIDLTPHEKVGMVSASIGYRAFVVRRQLQWHTNS
jgi:hypothetical protein